ncbi:AMP-binding protein [Caldiplasma sukawensis]
MIELNGNKLAELYIPDNTHVENSNLLDLAKKFGLSDINSLYEFSDDNILDFYEKLPDFLGIEFYQRYSKVADDSNGKEFTKWYVNGKINISYNCVERYKDSEKVAIIAEFESGERKEISYKELDRLSGKLAGSLKKLGLKKGDRVGIYLPMIPEAVISMYAIMRAGMVAVPIFSGYGEEAVKVRGEDAGIRYIFTIDEYERKGKKIRMAETIDGLGFTLIVINGKKGNWLEYNEFLESGEYIKSEEMNSEEPAIMLYTSGTTGKPKGTIHVHGGSFINVVKEVKYYLDFKEKDTLFWITDLGWMMGPWEIIGSNALGGTCVLYPGAVDYPNKERIWEIVEKNNVTILGLSPTFVRSLKAAGIKRSFKGLKAFASTGEPWDSESYDYLFKELGKKSIPICNVSGGTDIIGCFLASTPSIPLFNSCLYRGLGMRVKVIDDNGNEVFNSPGYLATDSHLPSMTRGIWKDNERYIKSYWSKVKGYWVHGDWAIQTKEGYFFLLGRSDDVIKTSGKRIGPGEIEDICDRINGVTETAVVGIPDEQKGEAIGIFYTGNNSQQTKMEIEERVTAYFGKSFRPKYIVCLDELPKTKNGKIMRRVLRAALCNEDTGDISTLANPDLVYKIKEIGKNILYKQ